MNYEIDKIDTIDIYSFSNVEFLKEFVTKNNLIEYDYKKDDEQSRKSYNTRSRLSSIETNKLNESLNCYLNKLDSDAAVDLTRDDMFSTTRSKRNTRSQNGKIALPECGKTYCRLGCICQHEQKKKIQEKHCGRFECMFECNCARRLRSSTRVKKEPEVPKTSPPESVCSRSSSNSSLSVRKSKRSKNRVNYFFYSKQGSSSSESSNIESVKKTPKFKPYIDTVHLSGYKVNFEVLNKNYENHKQNVVNFLEAFVKDFSNWKELNFSYEKLMSVKVIHEVALEAKVMKYKPKEVTKNSKILQFIKKFPQFTVQSFKYKKSQVNKENKEPVQQPESYKILPRLLCRKSGQTKAPELKNIFKNLETLFKQAPKKYDKISDGLKIYRDLEKMSLFKDEREYFDKKPSYDLYDPFSDESLILNSYKLVDSRDIVDSVSGTLNDMINVVCTHKENQEKKFDLNEFLPSVNQQTSYTRPNLLKRKSNVILMNKKDTSLSCSFRKILPYPQAGKTFVKILNTSEKNVLPVSIVNKPFNEKPIFKVSFSNDFKQCFDKQKKRKRKQDLSFLSNKIIDVNRVCLPIEYDIPIEDESSEKQNRLFISNSLFNKNNKKLNTRCDSDSFDDFSSVSIKEEPCYSDSTNYSQRYLTIESYDETDEAAQQPTKFNTNLTYNNSNLYEQKYSTTLSMLKFDSNNTNSSYSNSENSNQKISINLSSNSSYQNDSDESNDSDLENDDDISSSHRKYASLNIHSVRERQRRLRLKNLLTKLKYALYDIDETQTNVRNNPNLKHSKQATLAEAVDLVKTMETKEKQLIKEYNDLFQYQKSLLEKRDLLLSQL